MAVRIRQIGGLGGDEWNLNPPGLMRAWRNSPRRDLGDSIMLLDGLGRHLGISVTDIPTGTQQMFDPSLELPSPTCVDGKCTCTGGWYYNAQNQKCGSKNWALASCSRMIGVPRGWPGPWIEIGGDGMKFHPEGSRWQDDCGAIPGTTHLEWLRREHNNMLPRYLERQAVVAHLPFGTGNATQTYEWKRDWRTIPALQRLFPEMVTNSAWYPHRGIFKGSVPIAKVDHPMKGGEDWGLFINAVNDTIVFEFKKVPDRRSWLGSLWDSLKKFVGAIVGAMKDIYNKLAGLVCAVAKSPMLAMAAQAGALSAGVPPEASGQAMDFAKSLCEGDCSQANALVAEVSSKITAKTPIPEEVKNRLFLAGMSLEQVNALDSTKSLVTAGAMNVLAQKALASMCKPKDEDEPAPEEEKPSGIGVKVAIGIGAAGLLFLFLRR